MNRDQVVWFFDSQYQSWFQYNEYYDQIIDSNGTWSPRPQRWSRAYLTDAKHQSMHTEYGTAPRTIVLPPSPTSSHFQTPSPATSYIHTFPAPALPNANSRSPGTAAPMPMPYANDWYGTHAAASNSTIQSITTQANSVLANSSGNLSRTDSYHPTVTTVRRKPEGGNIMHAYDTPRPMQRSHMDGTEVHDAPTYHNSSGTETAGASSATLDSKFKRIQKSQKFFTPGKVFLTLWAEPAGDVASNLTAITEGISAGSFGEPIFSKIRRFVVIREGGQWCTALSILTYNRQGVSKKGVVKSEHAIIHTGKHAPSPLETEFPKRGEQGLLPSPIRVDPDNPDDKLDSMSRLDFAKTYTIHHNVKVRSVGKVNRASMQALFNQFRAVWLNHVGDPGADLELHIAQDRSSVHVEASSQPPNAALVAAFSILRVAGFTAETARAPLLKAGYDLSEIELEEANMNQETTEKAGIDDHDTDKSADAWEGIPPLREDKSG